MYAKEIYTDVKQSMNNKLEKLWAWIWYSSFGVEPSTGIINPGLVDDGTRCGFDRICINQECRNLSTLSSPTCPVGGNGLVCSGNTSGVSQTMWKKI